MGWHTFTSNAVNLLQASVICSTSAREYKTTKLNESRKARSEEWQDTASEWKIYKSNVTKLTRTTYKAHKHTINPNDLPTGKAGTDGDYHLDHIVPMRFCYENNIPEDVCAHLSNFQMLGWRENVGLRNKLKDKIPQIFESFII